MANISWPKFTHLAHEANWKPGQICSPRETPTNWHSRCQEGYSLVRRNPHREYISQTSALASGLRQRMPCTNWEFDELWKDMNFSGRVMPTAMDNCFYSSRLARTVLWILKTCVLGRSACPQTVGGVSQSGLMAHRQRRSLNIDPCWSLLTDIPG